MTLETLKKPNKQRKKTIYLRDDQWAFVDGHFIDLQRLVRDLVDRLMSEAGDP